MWSSRPAPFGCHPVPLPDESPTTAVSMDPARSPAMRGGLPDRVRSVSSRMGSATFSAPPFVDVSSPPMESGSSSLSRQGRQGLGLDPIPGFSEMDTDDTWVYPFSASNYLEKSNSIRSVRSLNEFEGKSMTPLPSPLIPSQELSEKMEMCPKDSKTDAFFNSTPSVLTPPKPPQSIARSASSRATAKTDKSTAIEVTRRRHRAMSSPQRFDESKNRASLSTIKNGLLTAPGEPSDHNLLTPHFPAHHYGITSLESKAGSRHMHGPSIHINPDSINPHSGDAGLSAQDDEPNKVNMQLLKSIDSVTEDEDEQAGKVGPYKIISLLGTGAFSKVLLAKPNDGSSSVSVALKMIACEPWKVDERMRVSWVREAETLKRISHPSIVSFLRAFRTPKHYTLVLEAVPGDELFELLSQHHAQVSQREWLVRRIFGELANAVQWMHSIHLVHRDIKLENIMLTRKLFASASPLAPWNLGSAPLIKITDFGLARFVKEGQLLETRCGSEEYAAPELILGKMYDGCKTDIWAMGVVLYAMITGAIPFLSPGPQETTESSYNSFKDSRERNDRAYADSGRERKAHLLRIVKCDLHWPEKINNTCQDAPSDGEEWDFDPSNRLVTPPAQHIITRFLRRDPIKRASCRELWHDPWFLYGSFAPPTTSAPAPYDDTMMLCSAQEASANFSMIPLPYCPEDPRGKKWLEMNASSTRCTGS